MATNRRKWVVLAAVLSLLIALRASLPYIARSYLNSKMARMGDYHGQIADIDLHLWRGSYSIEGLRIDKVSGKVPVPLLDAKLTELELSWRALSHGVLRGKVEFTDPTLNFVDGGGQGDSQSGKGVDWQDKLQLLSPMRLDELTVHHGTVTFHNFVSRPRVDLKMTEVEGTVLNLSNADRRQGRRVADLTMRALILENAPLFVKASFDPLEHGGDFVYELKATGIVLTRANNFARAYAGMDFAGGSGDFLMELEAKNGRLDGYAKPLFKGLQIFSWKQDVEQEHKGPIKLAWEALAQGVTSIFKNHREDQFATRVPISGRIDDKHVGALAAIVGVLRNAFIKAYSPQLEHLDSSEGKDPKHT